MATEKDQILRSSRPSPGTGTRSGPSEPACSGSSAPRPEATGESDLDFLVEFAPGAKTFDNYMDLKAFLEEIFSRRVDLVVSEVIKPRLRDTILRETVYAPGL